MIRLIALVCFAACNDVAVEDSPACPSVTGLDTPPRALCSYYQLLSTRYFRRQLPYVAPVSGIKVILDDPDFVSLWGQTDHNEDGTVTVWAPREMHYEDGSVEIGAIGQIVGDNLDWCEFRLADAVVD